MNLLDRSRGRALVLALRFALSLRILPLRAAVFMLRARRTAVRRGDVFSLTSAIRPADLAMLLRLADGRGAVFELGTGTAWSTVALALADGSRRIASYDPAVRAERSAYLALVPQRVRERIELRARPDSDGPQEGERVDLLFVDSAHDRESVLRAFAAWSPALLPGAVVAFHDYDHPSYPGVRLAIDELGLDGQQLGGMFVWRAPVTPAARAPLDSTQCEP